jgi:hypothetical protein
MRDIYRRPANVHALPKGWNEQDAVNYETISNIKGLQHYDNPLAGDQNATYGCKNVYQDESGNLTVRPSVRLLRGIESSGTLLGFYNLAIDELHRFTIDDKFYLSGKYGTIEIGSGDIAIQEANNIAYILCTSTDNKLRYITYDENGFADVVPDILNNNPNSLVSSRFNLLTDKYYASIMELAGKASLDRPWTDYDVEYVQLLSPRDNIVYKKYVAGTQYLISDDGILYGIGAKPTVINLNDTVTIDYLSKTEVCIWNDGTHTKLSIITSGHAICYIITTGSDNALSLVYDKTFDYGTVYPLYPMQNNCAVGINGGKYCVLNMQTLEVLFTAPYKYSSSILENGTSKPSLGYKIAEVWSDSMFVCLNEPDLVSTNDYADRLAFRLYSCTDHASKDITADVGIRNIYLNDCIVKQILNENATGFIICNESGEAEDIKLFHWGFNVNSLELSSYPALYSSDDSLTICDGEFHVYANDEFTKVDIQGYSEGGIYDAGGTLFMLDNNWNLLKRYVKSSKFEMIRPMSESFPLVSDIEDEVLTSFYLDNIHWFVTKHRIFGTGVANEQFSIKYFDPKKYFRFDETLTGAIRISDYSFWVFHSNGAYLIYKSTTQIYDELSGGYVDTITWLCTSTAESKGCDFDNGLHTLPITSYIVSVTSEDISYVQMHENVQTDDRILVPMTLQLRKFVSGLLHETSSVKITNYHYNTIFFLNPVLKMRVVPALVYNAATESWWYWEFPFDEVISVRTVETGIKLVGVINGSYGEYDLFTGYFDKTVNSLVYHIYADRITDGIKQISWEWESALLHFNSASYRKQLLFTTFMLGERETNEVSFEYSFEIYDKSYSDREWLDANTIVERAQSHTCRTNVAKFKCLQLCLRNKTDDDYSGYTKPKFTAISFKYRLLLTGGNAL